MKNNPSIEKLLHAEQKKIHVPSRAEFRSMINHVTNGATERNTKQKDAFWPFGISLRFAFVSSAAMLALVMTIVPAAYKYTHHIDDVTRNNTAITELSSSNEDVIQSIVNDILREFSDENGLVQQELEDESTFNDNGDIVDSLIS